MSEEEKRHHCCMPERDDGSGKAVREEISEDPELQNWMKGAGNSASFHCKENQFQIWGADDSLVEEVLK